MGSILLITNQIITIQRQIYHRPMIPQNAIFIAVIPAQARECPRGNDRWLS
jgi:hypothetical protein